MTRARDIANLVDANGDIVAGALDNVPAADVVNDTTPQLGGNLDTNGNDITFGDNDKAIFGAGSDLQIYHDGSASYITDAGTGNLKVQADNLVLKSANGNQQYALFTNSGAAEFSYNNATKLTTTSTGVSVTGDVQINSSASGSNTLEGSVSAYNVGQAQVNSRIDFLTDTYANTGQIKLRTNYGATTQDGLIVDEKARVTMPYQPYAFVSTSVNNYTPSAGDIVQFDAANTNRGNHYDTTNYRFTCPVAGDYLIVLWFSRYNFKGDLVLRKNGSNKHYLELRTLGATNEWQCESFSFVLSCAANDYLDWKVASVTASGTLLDGFGSAAPYDGVMYRLLG